MRLVDKYMSLLPPVGPKSKPNFYLHSMEKPNPAQWYSNPVVGLKCLKKTIGRIIKEGNIQDFFTNHSLRGSLTSRLFRAGIDRNLIKEFTGHRSDALDQYQIMSDEQHRKISSIISGPIEEKMEVCEKGSDVSNDIEVSVAR